MDALKTGNTITIEGCYAVNPDPPPKPKIGDKITIEGVDHAFRVAEIHELDGIETWRLEVAEVREVVEKLKDHGEQ